MLLGFYEGKGGGNNLNNQRETIGRSGIFYCCYPETPVKRITPLKLLTCLPYSR